MKIKRVHDGTITKMKDMYNYIYYIIKQFVILTQSKHHRGDTMLQSSERRLVFASVFGYT